MTTRTAPARRVAALVMTAGLAISACGGSDAADDEAPATSDSSDVSDAPEVEDATATSDAPTTDAPVTTEAPEPTDAPASTEAPVATDAPTTEAPAATEAPTTEAPAPTDAPADDAAVEDGRWVDPTGTFSVVFPDGAEPSPVTQTIPVPAAGESLEVTLYLVEMPTSATTAVLFDYTSIAGDDFAIDLQGAVDGAISNVPSAVLTSQTERTIQGRDAIEYEFTLEGGGGRALVVANGVSVVQLQALGANPDDVGSFIDTIEFLEDAP